MASLRAVTDLSARLPARRVCLYESDMTSTARLAPARYERMAFLSSGTAEAEEAVSDLAAAYGNVRPEEADVIVALGGDGLMLQVLHRFMGTNKPIYGMNRGSVGFLMNEYTTESLRERLAAAQP